MGYGNQLERVVWHACQSATKMNNLYYNMFPNMYMAKDSYYSFMAYLLDSNARVRVSPKNMKMQKVDFRRLFLSFMTQIAYANNGLIYMPLPYPIDSVFYAVDHKNQAEINFQVFLDAIEPKNANLI